MTSQLITFATIAARDSDFFSGVARQLMSMGHDVNFLNFYEPDTRRLRDMGFQVICIQEKLKKNEKPIIFKNSIQSIEKMFGLKSIRDLILHEKLTFGRFDENQLIDKAIQYLLILDDILSNLKPDLVVQELGGFIAPMSLFYCCIRQNIKHYFIEPMLFKGTLGFLENCINYSTNDICSSPSNFESIQSYLLKYKENKFNIVPDKDRHHFMDAKIGKFINLRNLKILSKKVINKYILDRTEEYNSILNHVLRSLGMAFNRFRIDSLYSDFERIKLNRYVFFPLHVPLDFQLTIRSPEWLNQIQLIEQISNVLPYDVKLLIKEHPASIGAYSKSELLRLLKNEDIHIVRASVNSFDLIKFSEAIITINSKVGTEALMQQKPLFVLGEVPYKNSNFCIAVESIRDLKVRLREHLKQENSNHFDWPAATEFFEKIYENSHAVELYVNTEENYEKFAKAIERAYSEGKSFKAQSDWVD